jgi:hypothetical protein
MRTSSSLQLLLVSAALSAGCGGVPASTEQTYPGPFDRELTLEIGANRVPCEGVAKFFCLLVREGAADWSYGYDSIHGLDPQWGTRYRVKVGVRNVANPPADGSSLAYFLEQVIDRQPVAPGTAFSFDIDRDLIEQDGQGFMLARERPFTCSPELCASVSARLQSPAPFHLTFVHPESSGEPLVLTGVADAAGGP